MPSGELSQGEAPELVSGAYLPEANVESVGAGHGKGSQKRTEVASAVKRAAVGEPESAVGSSGPGRSAFGSVPVWIEAIWHDPKAMRRQIRIGLAEIVAGPVAAECHGIRVEHDESLQSPVDSTLGAG
jgi:hypothetical protein